MIVSFNINIQRFQSICSHMSNELIRQNCDAKEYVFNRNKNGILSLT